MRTLAAALVLAAVTALSLASGSPSTQAAPAPPAAGSPRSGPCGMSPNDWCAAPAGDPCGQHKNTESCKADPKCGGMPYHGESVVACKLDARGFGINCPTVGCVSLGK
jgi:hypothetical protein